MFFQRDILIILLLNEKKLRQTLIPHEHLGVVRDYLVFLSKFLYCYIFRFNIVSMQAELTYT